MTAASFISDSIQPLRPEDTGHFALDQMAEFHLRHLPLVVDNQLLGLVSEDDILDHDPSLPITAYGRRQFSRPYALSHQHIYEIIRLAADFRLTAIPVVDRDDKYLGVITQEELLVQLGNMGSFTLPGSIIVLKMHRQDYSLAKISSIVEQENAAVVSAYITSDLQSQQAEVTLKINKKDLSRIIASFERHGFNVRAFFHESDFLNETVKERYESFMHFIKV